MRIILYVVCICFTCIQLHAQHRLNGKITDNKTGEAIAYASVLIKHPDSKGIITYTYSNEDGSFKLEDIRLEELLLEVDMMGYKPYHKILKGDTLNSEVEIKLSESTSQLEEVNLIAKKKAVRMSGDKMIFNLEKLGIITSSNGLEALRQLPGVTLDKDENVQFRGNVDVQLMINGKPTLLKGDALREYIRSLSAQNIDNVEIIAQPSARYDASGTAGIININLKKPKAASFSGNVYSAIGYAEYFKNRNGLNLYYNDAKWNINLGASYNKYNSVNHRNIVQTIQLEDSVKVLDQQNEWLPKTISKNITAGIERTFAKNHKISTAFNYSNSNSSELTLGTTNEYGNDNLYRQVKLRKEIEEPITNTSGNLFYNYTSDSLDTQLDIQLNYADYQQNQSGFLQNKYPVNPTPQEEFLLDIFEGVHYKLFTVQADVQHRFSKQLKLESGAKFSKIRMNYTSDYAANDSSQLFIPEDLLTNHFIYNEHQISAYAQGSYQWQKWNILAGIRAEYIDYSGFSEQLTQTNSNHYIAWFPSMSINYEKENHQYRLSYSRRIGRPNYLDLNPYYQYLDPYTLQKGNPALQPQFYHSFEVNYIYKNAMSASVYGNFYNDQLTSVIDYRENENYNLLFTANGATGNRLGISLNLPYEPTDWWNFQFSFDGYHTREQSQITDFSYDRSGFGYSMEMYHNVTLKDNWTLNASAFYSGRSQSGNSIMKPLYDFSLNIKKMLLDDMLKLELSCQNILKKSMWNSVVQQENVTTHWINRWETRKFTFGVTYNFGKGKSKKVKSTSLQEESSRM